jgi:SAM-dependent methyltransferase
MRDIFRHEHNRFFGKNNLYVGCGDDHEISSNGNSWINLDMNPNNNPDVVWNLNNIPLPFDDNSFDCIFSCHTLEHLHRNRFVHFVADAHRILKANGYLIGITPYGTTDVAWAMPQHNMLFSEITWSNLSAKDYEKNGRLSSGDDELLPFREWEIETITLVPYKEFLNDPEIEFKIRHYRNVIQDIHAVLRAIK